MKLSPIFFTPVLLLAACGSDDTGPTGPTVNASSGGTSASGGQAATGGQLASGGTPSGGASSGGTASGGSQVGGSSGGVASGGGPAGGSGGATGGATGGDTASGGAATGGSDSADVEPSAGCGKARSLNDGNHMMSTGGKNREYHVKAPDSYDNETPYRLIFMFHWNYGSINAIVNPPDADHNTDLPYYGLQEYAADTSIFVVPQGLTSVTGGAGWGDSGGEDIAFTEDMLEAVSDDLCVDKSRVFTMGFSFGGAISYKLACERDELFRAALVYDTGNVSGNNHALCTNPIAFFQSHGHDDGTFSYSSSQTILNLFASSNGCGNTPIPTAGTNEHVCTSLEGCMDGYPVRFCSFGSGQNNPHNTSLRGHYPSAKDPGQEKSWVPVEAWDFIQQF